MENKNLKGSIIELRKNGKSVNEISRTLKCAKSTVSFHINSHNLGGTIRPNNNPKPINDDDFINNIENQIINDIKKWKLSGLTYNELHANCNLSYDKIKRICRVLGINKNIRKPVNKSLINKIRETYTKHKSIRKTSIELKISRKLIQQYITIPRPVKLLPDEKKQYNVNAVSKHRRETKKKLIDYKGGKCEICGYNKNVVGLTFHHRNPEDKNFTIGGEKLCMG